MCILCGAECESVVHMLVILESFMWREASGAFRRQICKLNSMEKTAYVYTK